MTRALRIFVALWLCATPARAQEVKARVDLTLPDAERLTLYAVPDDPVYLVVMKPRGGEDVAVVTSARPAEPIVLTGLGPRGRPLLTPTAAGGVVTWMLQGKVQQVQLATGQRSERSQPFAGGARVVAASPGGEVLVDGSRTPDKTELALLGAQPRFFPAVPANVVEADFTADGRAVVLTTNKGDFLLELAAGRLEKHEGRRPPRAKAYQQVHFLFEVARIEMNEQRLEVGQTGETFWSADDGTDTWVVAGGDLVYLSSTPGPLTLKRVSFPGGIDAWTKQRARAPIEARRKAEAEAEAARAAAKARREAEDTAQLERALDAARKDNEARVAAAKAEEARLFRIEQERFNREVAPRLAAERAAAEQAKKAAPTVKPTPSRPARPSEPEPPRGVEGYRAQMERAANDWGFTQLLLERRLEDRPGVVYLGTPHIPSTASELLVLVVADPELTASIGYRGAQTIWGGRPNTFAQKVDATPKQLFCTLVAKPGVSRVPLYVMVYAR
jgi:hypothetical protein